MEALLVFWFLQIIKNANKYFTAIPDKQIIYGKLDKSDNGDALMMTYNEKDNNVNNLIYLEDETNDLIFVNIFLKFINIYYYLMIFFCIK